MVNAVIVLVVAALVGGAVVYIRKAKKRGVKSVGCPDAKTCGKNCGCCGGCPRK